MTSHQQQTYDTIPGRACNAGYSLGVPNRWVSGPVHLQLQQPARSAKFQGREPEYIIMWYMHMSRWNPITVRSYDRPEPDVVWTRMQDVSDATWAGVMTKPRQYCVYRQALPESDKTFLAEHGHHEGGSKNTESGSTYTSCFPQTNLIAVTIVF